MADVIAPPQPIKVEPAQQLEDSPVTTIQTSPSSASSANNTNVSRRPTRKSTLTQQQRLSKRQRATQDQLLTLEVEFNKNPTPTALVRERIASDINMTERSVQIWFQNRRAKIKNIAKRSIESGEDCENIPESMRQYLAMQQYGPGKGMAASLLGRAGPGLLPYGNGMVAMHGEGTSGKVVIQHFACRSLSIGTWRRVGQSTMDLVIFYSPDKGCVTYYINNDSAGYKIEYPFAWIKNISLEQGDALSAAEGASQRAGGLLIELSRPPKFYMDSSGSGGFYECGDFTEDQQASLVMTHHLGGPSKVLSGQLAKLVSLESYQNRHALYDPNAFAISAPVSPIGHRPQSQPNHIIHPHNAMTLFPPDATSGLMGPPAPRGHKRQRSRSVPVAMDFSTLRHPMPSFLIQPEGHHAPAPVQDSNIFAPVPQHQPSNAFAPGPAGPNLSIDTSAAYSMGMAFGPVSATTTVNSPSDYGTPAFFGSAPTSESMQPGHFTSAFNNGYLAVDPTSMIGTSNTPLSMISHGDPVIADQSPPLTGLGRAQSTDIFDTQGDRFQAGDDGIYLSESFNKQITLPFRSPLSEDSFHSPMPEGMYSFQSPPASRANSQGNVHMHDHHTPLNFQSPPPQTYDGSTPFQSPPSHTPQPQLHQDSGVAFSTPAHAPQDKANLFNSPKDSGMVYQDANMYASPGQMNVRPNDNHFYAQNPGEELDVPNYAAYGTIDPTSLGRHQ